MLSMCVVKKLEGGSRNLEKIAETLCEEDWSNFHAIYFT